MSFLIRMLLASFLFFSCGHKKAECNENPLFKQKFFQSIQDAEDGVFGKSHDRGRYNDGLAFLDDYVFVDYEKTLNYRNVYTLKGFEDDKKEWLKWYEANKCDNIQFKKVK